MQFQGDVVPEADEHRGRRRRSRPGSHDAQVVSFSARGLALGKPNVNVYLIDEPSSCRSCVLFCSVLARTKRISVSWLGAAHNCGKGHQVFHPTRNDSFCYRARFHNGNLPRRPRHLSSRALHSCYRCHRHRHTECSFWFPRLIYCEDLIALVSLQSTIATHGNEQIPATVGNNVPSRHDQHPPTCGHNSIRSRTKSRKVRVQVDVV
jgi:hypothetical protein